MNAAEIHVTRVEAYVVIGRYKRLWTIDSDNELSKVARPNVIVRKLSMGTRHLRSVFGECVGLDADVGTTWY